jgi:hypothetical protein
MSSRALGRPRSPTRPQRGRSPRIRRMQDGRDCAEAADCIGACTGRSLEIGDEHGAQALRSAALLCFRQGWDRARPHFWSRPGAPVWARVPHRRQSRSGAACGAVMQPVPALRTDLALRYQDRRRPLREPCETRNPAGSLSTPHRLAVRPRPSNKVSSGPSHKHARNCREGTRGWWRPERNGGISGYRPDVSWTISIPVHHRSSPRPSAHWRVRAWLMPAWAPSSNNQ